MIRVAYTQLEAALVRALAGLGFTAERANLCGRLFAETTRDGVYTHGLERFPRFVAMVRSGVVDKDAAPSPAGGFGAVERWNGNRGPGNLNAWASMQRAVDLARSNGIGAVFLAATNHWMRGGTFAWQAADAGCLSLCWTNTMPNLPAWGASEAVLGNNPLVMGVPRANGRHVVLDMAMSQFSYGALAGYAKRGQALPVPGGFNLAGELTQDAAAIEASARPLPIGMWKGSGLSLMLDLFAASLSGGLATWQMERDPLKESKMSQVFVTIDASVAGNGMIEQAIAGILASLKDVPLMEQGKPVRYPGEQTWAVRQQNLREGVPVDEGIWAALCDGEL